MANSTNNLGSNFTTPLAKEVIESMESSRVLTKTVNIQKLTGLLSPQSGTTVDFKRPYDVKVDRTAGGDISSADKSDIVRGKATGTVQNYITVHMDWDEVDESLKLGGMSELGKVSASRIVTALELDLGAYMAKNCNLYYGTPGTAITTWTDVAGAGALAKSIGIPDDSDMFYVLNPYMAMNLANVQHGLANGSGEATNTAWQNAKITNRLGNMNMLTSNALSTYTSGTLSAGANRAGTLSATPTATYVGHKDTMIQSLAVTGFGAGADTIKAGEIVQVTGRNRLSIATRSAFTDATGAQVLWSGVVTADVTLSGGAGTLLVAGAGIFEANGQYNTVDTALTSGDVITIINPAASTVYQPSMFYHKSAFGLGTVKLAKLYATDTVATTEDGLSIRVTRYSDGDTNKQKLRFDLLPAYVTFDPFKAGQAFG